MKLQEKIIKKTDDLFQAYVYPLINKKRNVKCPCCGWTGPRFLHHGLERRPNSRCPKCDSLERFRLYYLYLKKTLPADKPIRVLHFAPEKIISKVFMSYPNVDYLSVDINPAKAMQKEDITNLSFADHSFDLIFCSHVLEHIPDDRKAMREIKRVLKPDGLAILLVPIMDSYKGRKIEKTYEDFSITDPKQREMAFGQHDHVRIYARDFNERLEEAGFNVTIDKFVESLSIHDVERYALMPKNSFANETDGWIYCCRRS
ncbi:MAG TPA: class I SAM-dependent methyltransferase [Cyclobacteriaceae bacterium]|nr:class I SAM-dependent methyltransferase [Cyclobacteriaceae bacterium]HRJ83369.1 class I SAM-dependent methyltransferase [Cyclobacteriaceae bacterium]